jgi:SAM-dependent methyltransferase
MGGRLKSILKSSFPAGVRAYRRLSQAHRALRFRVRGMEKVFSDIYRNNSWADPESVSGRGSTLAHTGIIRRVLPVLLNELGAKSILDAPCGDFNWMQHVDLGAIEYLGADVVPELIAQNRLRYAGREFVVLDITKDELPMADVILCRDCFIHLSLRHTRAAIESFKRSGSTYLLATTHTGVRENTDMESGGGRYLNLQLAPFGFPAPLRLIEEDMEFGKCLGLWRLSDL